MDCVIYKSLKKSDVYLFIENEDDFSPVPESLLTMLGKLEFVMNLELSSDRKLALADPGEVCSQLVKQGYYLQLPPG